MVITFEEALKNDYMVTVESDKLKAVRKRYKGSSPTLDKIIRKEPLTVSTILHILKSLTINRDIEYLEILLDCEWHRVL